MKVKRHESSHPLGTLKGRKICELSKVSSVTEQLVSHRGLCKDLWRLSPYNRWLSWI